MSPSHAQALRDLEVRGKERIKYDIILERPDLGVTGVAIIDKVGRNLGS